MEDFLKPKSDKKEVVMENQLVGEELFGRIKSQLIEELEGAMRVYTNEGKKYWVNQETCASVIRKLKEGESVMLEGPFYGDYLDGVLYDLGIKSNDRTGRYEEVRKRLRG